MTSISVGSHVQWPGGRGRVDLIVTKGTVPGVNGEHADPPAARVVVWSRTEGRWEPTGRRVAVPTAELQLAAPPVPDADGADRLVALLAAHHDYVAAADLPGSARPSGTAVKQVYLRGLNAWPGADRTDMRPQEWALRRVAAFLKVAAGGDLPGYHRDLDLLPEEHPSFTRHSTPAARVTATKRAPSPST